MSAGSLLNRKGQGITRRKFLKASGLMGASALIGLREVAAQPSNGLIDVNVSLFRFPTRRLPLDQTAALTAKLRRSGARQAWAGSFEALLTQNPANANRRLYTECKKAGRGILLPFGTVNPKHPDWRDELRRCRDQYRMTGLRLFPGFHRYAFDDPAFTSFFEQAASMGMVLQIMVDLDDVRLRPPLLSVPAIDAGLLLPLLKEHRQVPIVMLNWFRSVKPALVKQLTTVGQVYWDIAMVETVGGIANLTESIEPKRILFGSHAPFFYFDAARLKLQESEMSQEVEERIRFRNATEILEA